MTGKEMIFYEKIIPHMDVIFDVGVRDDSPFYDINNDAEIHMFEPVTKFVRIMQNRYKDKEHNIKFNNFGLGSKEETKEFHYRYGSLIKRDNARFKDMHDSYDIDITTVDKYCASNSIPYIDYLKIDTEGYDFEVIKGASDMLYNIRFIQFEDFNIYYNGETLQDLFDYFKGWNIYKIGGKPCNYLATKENVNLEKIR